MSQHAVASASGSEQWETCAKSLAMQKGKADSSSEYADEGTAAHLLGSTCLEENTNPVDYLGRTIYVGRHTDGWDGGVWDLPETGFELRVTHEVGDEMVAAITTYVDVVRTIANGALIYPEQRLPISHITGEEGAEGTGDAVIMLDDELVIIDLKYGYNVVAAKENKQLLKYASGALERFDITHGPFKRVRLVICQPRVSIKPDEWDCSVEELQKHIEEARPKAALALAYYECADAVQAEAKKVYDYLTGVGKLPKDADAALQHFGPSPASCKYCKAKAECPAAILAAQEAARVDFKAEPLPEVVTPEDYAGLRRVLEWAPYLEKLIKACRGKMEALLFEHKNSAEIREALGYKIVAGKKGNREFGDEEAVIAYCKSARLSSDLTHVKKLKSPAQMEKAIKKDYPIKWSRIEEMITQKDGQPSVAPLDDPREPYVLPDAADDFTAEEPAKIF